MSKALEITDSGQLLSEVRRVRKGRIASARKGLGNVSDDPDSRIHEVRKDLKRLRALIRLVRRPLGKACFKEENKTFRNAGRKLAPFRDAAARVVLVKSLREKQTGDISGSALTIAEKKIDALYEKTVREDEVRLAAREADQLLEEAEGRLKDWLPEESGFGLFREGLEETYEDARIGLARCLILPTSTNFHEWRKHCKYLRYQIEFLQPALPKKFKKAEKALHDLTDLLGSHHDLAVLGETLEPLAKGVLSDAELWAIHQAFETEERRIVKQCWSVGRRFFEENSKEFVDRIEAYWNAACAKK